jgi:hypothetical protein
VRRSMIRRPVLPVEAVMSVFMDRIQRHRA